MSQNPLVSIIIPCYNHENYVEKAILSALDQTYNEIEVIVIDDGSRDRSVELIKSLLETYAFKFIQQENMGVCKTLNRAVRSYASGEYISILASDDYWDESKIGKQITELRKNSRSEFCYTQAVEFDSSTGETLRVFPKKKYIGNILDSLIFRQPYAAGTIMFSRKLFDQLNGFNENLGHEDWDFSIRSASVTEFCCVEEPLLYYRSHDENISKTSGRRGVFQEKMKTLAINYHLARPFPWIRSVLLHFVHDHFLYKFNLRRIKRFFY